MDEDLKAELLEIFDDLYKVTERTANLLRAIREADTPVHRSEPHSRLSGARVLTFPSDDPA